MFAKSKDDTSDMGGPSQMLKVYERMNSVQIAVKWS